MDFISLNFFLKGLTNQCSQEETIIAIIMFLLLALFMVS